MSYVTTADSFACAGIQELSFDEVDSVNGAVNWFAVGRVVGTAVRLGAIGGGVGIVAAVGVTAGALAIDYALDGEADLLK